MINMDSRGDAVEEVGVMQYPMKQNKMSVHNTYILFDNDHAVHFKITCEKVHSGVGTILGTGFSRGVVLSISCNVSYSVFKTLN